MKPHALQISTAGRTLKLLFNVNINQFNKYLRENAK